MPKKSTGYTPSKSQSNPTMKESVPLKSTTFPEPIKGPNNIASLPKNQMPKAGSIGKPPKLNPRPPRI